MHWFILIMAGACEVAFATCLKLSDNFKNWGWAAGFLFFATLSYVLLSIAIKTIPMGTAYAVWTGIGAVGMVLFGIFLFKEPVTFWRVFFLSTLIFSILGLKFMSGD